MARKCRCAYPTGWAIAAAILTALGIAAVIVSSTTSSAVLSRTKICIVATNELMPPGVLGDPDGLVVGAIDFDVNNEHVNWDLHYSNTTAIEAIHLVGPFPSGGDPRTGPLHIALCGMPSSLACSNSGNRVQGGIVETLNGGSVGQKIREYESQRERYFVLIKTQGMPDGSVRDFLNKRC